MPEQSTPVDTVAPMRTSSFDDDRHLIVVDIERAILEKGYGCKTRVESGETLPMLAALQRGDVDVNSEIWLNSVREPWEKALATGSVYRCRPRRMRPRHCKGPPEGPGAWRAH